MIEGEKVITVQENAGTVTVPEKSPAGIAIYYAYPYSVL